MEHFMMECGYYSSERTSFIEEIRNEIGEIRWGELVASELLLPEVLGFRVEAGGYWRELRGSWWRYEGRGVWRVRLLHVRNSTETRKGGPIQMVRF